MAVDPFGALARMKRPMRESPERASSGSLSSFSSFGSPGSFGLSDATEPGPYRREAARTACAGGPPPFASPVRTPARRSGSGARRRAYFAMKIPDVGQVPCVPASVTSDAALGNCDVASVFTEIHASVK